MIEQYDVKFNYLKSDGHWCNEVNELVNVTVNREKCNHQLASNVIKSRYANCEIIKVSYV